MDMFFAAVIVVFCTPMGWLGMLAFAFAAALIIAAIREKLESNSDGSVH